MRKINASHFIITLFISFGILFIFSTNTAMGTSNQPSNFTKDNGAGFLGNSPNYGGKGFWDQLTEEQKKELRNMINEMKNQGASRKEIRAAINEKLKEWGIDRPKRKKRGKKGFWDKLTDAQKKELRDMINEMKSQGASRKEIRAAINKKLKEWGIERN